jgi:cell wall-associated NlpC family hydrolase
VTPNSTVAVVVLAGPLGLILFVVILLGGGASSGSEQLAGQTGTVAPLNASAVPDPSWVPYIEQAGSLCPAITAPLIAAQDAVESDWAPDAVSAKGAEGIAQFMPATWPAYSSPPAVPGPDTPFVVPDAVLAQGRMDCALVAALTPLSGRSGVPALSLALEAYNAGLASVTGPGGATNMQAESYAAEVEQLSTTTYAELSSAGTGASGATGASAAGTTPTGTAPAGTAPAVTSPLASFAQAVVGAAEAELGLPYVWGGGTYTAPSGDAVAPPSLAGQPGFDCSGLVMYALYQASGGAITLPHSSQEQVTLGQQVAVGSGAQVLASGVVQPGDVIGFFNLDNDGQWDHVGIYVGNGEMIDAPATGQVVSVTNLATPRWMSVEWDVRSFGQ